MEVVMSTDPRFFHVQNFPRFLSRTVAPLLALAMVFGVAGSVSPASATGLQEMYAKTDTGGFLKRMLAPRHGLQPVSMKVADHDERRVEKPDGKIHKPNLAYDDRRMKHVNKVKITKIRKYTPKTITNTNINNINIDNNINVVTSNTATVRSGVKYVGGKQTNIKTAGKVHETYRIKKTRMGVDTRSHTRTKGGFVNSGLIVLNINTGAPQMQEVAGSVDVGEADCAYGSFCTINLGGPKIITFNDVADISDGEFAVEDPGIYGDEDLTDEEYIDKYGEK